MNILNPAACLASAILFSASLHAAPLKVYLLAGQSNMQGHSTFTTLGHLKTDDSTKRFYDAIVDDAGKPRVIDRVWISCLNEDKRENSIIVSSQVKSGPLKHGYGATGDDKMGPELGFGITMSELHNGPILIIKSAFGGTNLNTDWRPPSTGPLPSTREIIRLPLFIFNSYPGTLPFSSFSPTGSNANSQEIPFSHEGSALSNSLYPLERAVGDMETVMGRSRVGRSETTQAKINAAISDGVKLES